MVDIKHLSDPPAERYVLSGLYHHGIDAFIDNEEYLDEEVFTISQNKILFACMKYAFTKLELKQLDIAAIHSCANDLGLLTAINKEANARHIQSITEFPSEFNEINAFCNKIYNLLIARKQLQTLDLAKEKLLNISGSENTDEILGIAENTIFEFISSVSSTHQEINNLLQDTADDLLYRVQHPIEKIGIRTGFNKYDDAIGGGQRRGTVNITGARIKVGKTMWGMNIGYNVAQQNIPVLYLDTEMTTRDFRSRMLSRISKVKINDVELGRVEPQKLKIAINSLKEVDEQNLIFHHKSIAGVPTERHFSIMKRWIYKNVGFTDGVVNDCLIIYDYLKLMDPKDMLNMPEHQAIGYLLTKLHNFAVKFDVPVHALVQLNRDGITKETSDVMSQSDRIAWLCSNFSILKYRSREEMDITPPEYGTHKLIPVFCRHGEGLPEMEFIHIKSELSRGYFEEGLLNSEADDDFATAFKSN